ncbi:MAG: YaaR family protein [Veillonellales bacterium]
MKINNVGAANAPLRAEHELAGKPGQIMNRFAADLLQTQDGQYKGRMKALLDEISKQGVKLGQVPTYAELKTYREMVRKFVGEAVGRMYTVQSQSGWDRQGRQKLYTTIRQIDDQLAGLTEDVRNGQERQLEIMARQDAIRGMLVDIYM